MTLSMNHRAHQEVFGMDEQLQEIVQVLEELKEDVATPKSVKAKIQRALDELKNNKERNIAIHKALNELDELADNTAMEGFTRSQIFSIVSLLESLSI